MSTSLTMTRRVLRRRSAKVTLIAVTAVVLVAVTAELVARSMIESRVSEAAGRALDGDLHIETGGGFAVLDLFDKHLAHLEIDSGNATVGRITGASVQAELEDVRLKGGAGGGTVERTHANVVVPATSVQQLVQNGRGIPVHSVVPDPASDTLTFNLGGQVGLGRVVIAPELLDGTLAMSVVSATLLGRPAPDDMVAEMEDGFTDSADPGDYPLELEATYVEVVDAGIKVGLDGGSATLSPRD
ncbi:DUF2993 domain-containing protein [Streptomyces sp. MUM 203J]|uniref:LmeA family phospholipid-binding protein n=1 Tax=Streptomyces sp. MUM 203J TaxID=2791990 RepID=UPI001F040DA3|nr:LmeA family phospholipid-binding protein [Streptomyces sp. MUM 203J]MCH0542003.1 DUF2993 domain-containing protein [Streptomyces sp. MUM 203J]